jgi:predicted PurR-regulated permease PerM
VAKTLEHARLPATLAAALSVSLLAIVVAGLLAVAIPSISSWATQAPYLTYTLQHKLEGLRASLAIVRQVTEKVEQAAATPPSPAAAAPEKVVVRDKSLLGELATTTPVVIVQIVYAGVLAFMLLAHRNSQRRQLLRMPGAWPTRVRLARMMRDINDRVGTYLFSLAVINSGVAVAATAALALLDFPNAIVWGIVMGLASFVPFIGPPVAIGLVALVALIGFDDWLHVLGAPLALCLIHFAESQVVTPIFVSRRCALNTVAVFVAIALLGWMWGAVGAIVAVPLLILLSTISAHLPSLRWLEVLLSDDRPVSERVARKPPLASVPSAPAGSRSRQRRRPTATR